MYWTKKLIFKTLVAVMLCFSMVMTSGAVTTITVEAAVKAPTVKESEQTLYTGYDTYTIGFNNLVKGAKIIYKSSDPNVASVSAKGVVKPLMEGSAKITATVKQNKKTYTLKVAITVKDPYVEYSQSTDYLNEGESFTFKAEAFGMDSKVVYSSSDLETASINSAGRVTALKSGTVTIFAEAGDSTVKCQMNIGTNRIGTFSKDITIHDEYMIWVNVDGLPEKETISWDTGRSDIIDCNWFGDWEGDRAAVKIKPLKAGTDTLIFTSNKTNDKLVINVTVVDEPKDKKVLTASEIYEKCGPSTVEISATVGEDKYFGSGFYVAPGMIVTNYHVIEGADKIIVTTYDKKQFEVKTIYGYNKDIDLAVLQINKENDCLTISQDKVSVGQSIYTLGSPNGLTGTMSSGMVSTASRDLGDGVDFIQIDAPITHGSSGGPLVNEYGEVIGINTAGLEAGDLNFAINIKELQKINTNHPITIEEYHKQYLRQIMEEFEANNVAEDPSVSQDINTCQKVPLGKGAYGTLKASEKGDIYCINLERDGILDAVLYYDNEDDMKNTIFRIEDLSGGYLEGEEYSDFTEELYVNLPAGTYYLYIKHADNNYSGGDIDYLFTTRYVYK